MLLFSYGMDRGLSSLGNQAGRSLPRAWAHRVRPAHAWTASELDSWLLPSANGLVPASTEFLTQLATPPPTAT